MGAQQQMMIASFGASGGLDPYFANVSALLHMDGADGSTTFTDQTGKVWTRVGTPDIDTAFFKYGTASGDFSATGNYIHTPADTSLNLGTGEFTLELWLRPGGLTGGSYRALLADFLYPTAGGWTLYRNGVAIEFWKGGAKVAEKTTGISESVWNFVTVVRRNDAGTMKTRVYINGVGGTEVTDSTNYSNNRLQIAHVLSGSHFYGFGHFDEVRVTKGVARYTADFTPPAAAFPDS